MVSKKELNEVLLLLPELRNLKSKYEELRRAIKQNTSN